MDTSRTQGSSPNLQDELQKLPVKDRIELQRLLSEEQRLERKHQLECRRLEDEVRDGRKAPWHRLSFYSSAMPLVIALVGIIGTWRAGWFDAQQQKLDAGKALLELEVKQLSDQRLAESGRLTTLSNELDSVSQDLEDSRKRLFELEAAFSKKTDEHLKAAAAGAAATNQITQMLKQLKDANAALKKSRENEEKLTKKVKALEVQARHLSLLRRFP